ncbi:uncharacterized protein LOC144640972 isoform X2 [Oculina patagonica]
MAEREKNEELDKLLKENDEVIIEFVRPSRKAEMEENVELEEIGKTNDENAVTFSQPNRKETLIKIIEEGNIDEITREVTPKALTNSGRNALLVAMEANFKLRNLANEKGPSADEFTRLATSVDEFTSCLLDSLKSKTEARHIFGNSLTDLMDVAIDWEQKKFFVHPVLFDLMSDKWLGAFGRMKRSSWLTAHRWMWIFLNIWCLFDLVMFPFLFAGFYLKHLRNKNRLKDKGIEIAFLINTTSKIADKAFLLIKRCIKKFIAKHGDENAKYQVIIHGDDSSPREICLKSGIEKDLKRGATKIPALHEDLKKVNFSNDSSTLKKVIIIFTDHQTSLKHERTLVENQVNDMKGINLVPVAIGSHVNIRELEKIANNGHDIIHFGEFEKPETVSKRIWHELHGKDMFESYLEYFTTPYFIFVRDTLSYLTLLGLHFALCLAPSSIPFSGLEWVILVFFMGRILMESKQFLNVKTQNAHLRREDIDANKQIGYDPKKGGGNEDNQNNQVSRSTLFLKKCGKYLSDRWNILDSTTLMIYFITFLLRMVTWAISASVTNNRALVIAGYLYGLNTMFLTLRAFGHVMETIKGVGAIQIALFHIIGDIATIFWQFIATILAFSIAMTKVYVAERSYIALESDKDSLACKTSGISCWWAMVQHLSWSLLGIAELDPLDSVDSPSVTLARFLFGAFLIMGVILLVNMMIALLSNTYQRVEDNACMEWSFKKAITIQTYSTYHPIPVPLNLISNLCIGLYRLCKKCMAGCREQKNDNDCNDVQGRIKSLDAVVKNLQLAYFSTYGYSFPLTDDRKIDQVIEETGSNRRMANRIAHQTFIAHASEQVMLPTGPKAWQSQGVRIEDCLLVCEGGNFCSVCKGESDECHGARYLVPFSRELPHFEVLIQETEDQRSLGVGVVWQDSGNHAMPGHFQKTVGYIVDEGKIFGPFEPVNFGAGKEYEGSMAYRGDMIGCTVIFDQEKDGKVPIVFTLNGKQITQDKILMEYKPPKKSLYPFISMGHTGIRVLAKMCPCPNDDLQLIGKIEATTHGIAEKMTSNLEQVEAAVSLMYQELDNAEHEFEKLIKLILKDLRHLNQLIEDPDQLERDDALLVLEEVVSRVTAGPMLESGVDDIFYIKEPDYEEHEHEPIRKEEIIHLLEQDGPGLEDQQAQNSLLKRAQENLEELTQTADMRFESVLRDLERVKIKATSNKRCLKEEIDRVERELFGFEELLKDLLKSHLDQSSALPPPKP